MVSRQEDEIDFDKLEKELDAAVDADVRYWRENDAKLRAVHQKVATYDEFRDIVLAAHLKPLEKTDKIGQTFKQPWNALTGNKEQLCSSSKQDTNRVSVPIKLPSTGHEFARMWKSIHKTSQQRYNFLLHIGAQQLEHIFHAEISFGLLGEILIVQCSEYKQEDYSDVLAILCSLARVNRFNLSLQFLDKTERTACSQLFDKLRCSGDDAENATLTTVGELYGVK